MNKKVAKLVEVSFTVRVIVDENATDDTIIQATYPELQGRLDNREVGDNVTVIEDDTEVPFGEGYQERTCLNCGHQFKMPSVTDELGKHCSCPECNSTFDVEN